MLEADTRFFLSNHDDSRLHPGTIISAEGDVLTGRLDEGSVDFDPGQQVDVCYEIKQQFMKQPARIEPFVHGADGPVIIFKTTGEPVSVERRQRYRVVTLMESMTAVVAGEETQLADVSVDGFSVITTTRYQPGATLSATIRRDQHEFAGNATVQSIKELSGGRFRYGMACDQRSQDLQRGLQRLSMEIQRKQLRRLAG